MDTFLSQVHPEELLDGCTDCPFIETCENVFVVRGNIEDEFDEIDEDQVYPYDDEPDQFLTDAEADSDALISAGWGTDEDYGYYGETDEW